MDTYIAVVSAVTALVAVIVGPLVSLYLARQQFKADTIAASRHQWINTLRDALADYLGALAICGARSASCAASTEATQDSLESLCRLESKIRLLLNPTESDHSELIQLLRQASAAAWVGNVPDPSRMPQILDDYRSHIIEKSQAILKREWNRVKRLELDLKQANRDG